MTVKQQNTISTTIESGKKDPLTKLPDRTSFYTDLHVLLGSNKNVNNLYVAIFDVDDLKSLNVIEGYLSGDALLRQIASIFIDVATDDCMFYRLGNDEFSLIYKNAKTKTKFVAYMKELFYVFYCYGISISTGISCYPKDSTDAVTILKYADLALKFIKSNGKNNFAFFTKKLYQNYCTKRMIRQNIIKALHGNLFELYYQPQFDIENNSLRGFEALIRYHDSDKLISPSSFIPIAEETKLITYVGRWIIENAFATLKKWQKETNFNGIIAINVSPVQLEDPLFIHDFSSLLQQYEIDTSKIEIEITEQVLIKNFKRINAVLCAIHKMGVSISLDDFGTGYASLRYLEELPCTTIKMDKSFTDRIEENKGDNTGNEIIQDIISIVSHKGIATIAEGVENDKQLETLRTLKCKYMQGFLWGKPMPQEQCINFLKGNMNALDHLKCQPHSITLR
jgi:diguanylate cyclase (GGDEF)-like protein